jgi:hypothetical protein
MSSKKILFAKKFNEKLFEFLGQVISMYPQQTELKSVRTQLRMGVMAKETLPIESFQKYLVQQFASKIEAKDEDFFLSFDVSGTALESLSFMKNMYKDATEGTKTALWQYVQLLTKISQRYSTM